MYNRFIENFFSKQECEDIIEFSKTKKLIKLTSVYIDKDNNFISHKEEDEENKNRRNGTMYSESEIIKTPSLKKIYDRTIQYINDEPPYKGMSCDGIPKFTFNKYEKGDYLNHHFDGHEIELGATITIIYQLNDNYDGGDVTYIINDEELIVPKKQGSIFIFDSRIVHSVKKVKYGCRYSMNSWPVSKIEKKSLV